MVKILAIIGSRDSGKTTVGEFLVQGLTHDGFRVGAIKHVHDPSFNLDVEGKDTWRYSHAGASVVACVGERQITVMRAADKEPSVDGILTYMSGDELDVVLLEGLKSESAQRTDIFKIVTAKTMEDLKETMSRTVPPILAITGVIAQERGGSNAFGVAVVDLQEEASGLVELVKKRLSLHEPRPRSMKR